MDAIAYILHILDGFIYPRITQLSMDRTVIHNDVRLSYY